MFRRQQTKSFLLIFIAASIIPIFIFGVYSNRRFNTNIYNVMEESFQQAAINGARSIDNMIERYNSLTKLLYSFNSDFPFVVFSHSSLGLAEIIKKTPTNDLERHIRSNEIASFLNLIQFSDPYIRTVRFAEPDGSWHVLGRGNRFFMQAEQAESLVLHNKALYDVTRPLNRMILIPTFNDNTFLHSEGNVFTIGRHHLDISDPVGQERRLGTLFMDISIRVIDDLFRHLDLYRKAAISVVDDNGILIYANPFFHTVANNSNNYIRVISRSASVPWYLIIRVDYSKAMKNAISLNRMMVVFIVTIMIAMLILAFFYSNQLSRYISSIRWKEAEIVNLKAAIKPHFLFNTLEMIRMNALTNNISSTVEMIENLADKMRFSIEDTREMITLALELEMIKNYISFVRINRDNKITCDIIADADLDSVYVPSLILQPVVENAVKHGIEPESKGHVEINVVKKHKNLLIKVKDDGVGMESEKVAKLKTLLNKKYGTSSANRNYKSIGLKNVHDRLRYSFGKPYGISVKSAPGAGTTVRIFLPLISELNGGGGCINV